LNITPDSFSDGGKFRDHSYAIEHAQSMIDDGADFIDVGGESTRPGSDEVSIDEELRRVIPVIEGLKNNNIPVSIDTYKSRVAEKALEAGAIMVNDISSFNFDKRMPDVISKFDASVILMHLKYKPKTMQENPQYQNVISEIKIFFENSIKTAINKGIHQIIVDPGIGFGKTLEHNIEIFKNLREFLSLGYPVMVGPSRKSFIGSILNLPVSERLEGTAAAVAVSILNGANIVRVHDVKEMKRVAKIIDVLK
jgi:dihydropteroate synthase